MGRPLRIDCTELGADERRFRGAHDRIGDGPCCVDAQLRITVRR